MRLCVENFVIFLAVSYIFLGKDQTKGSIVGSIMGTFIATVYYLEFIDPTANIFAITVMTLILSVVGQIGDFAASSIKRFVDIKDFSNLIPGHGGMLDRIDSVLFIAPIAYFLLSFI